MTQNDFEGKTWSPTAKTQESVREQSKATIALSNEYASQIVGNNEKSLRYYISIRSDTNFFRKLNGIWSRSRSRARA